MINECCKVEANLEEVATAQVSYPDGGDAGTLIIRRCKVCGRAHYEHQVVPLQVGLSLESKRLSTKSR